MNSLLCFHPCYFVKRENLLTFNALHTLFAKQRGGLRMGDKKIYFVTYVTIHPNAFLQFCRRKLKNVLYEKRYIKN
jgi:hypothetical protein